MSDTASYSWKENRHKRKIYCHIAKVECEFTIFAIAENEDTCAKWHSVDCSKEDACKHYKEPDGCDVIEEIVKDLCQSPLTVK